MQKGLALFDFDGTITSHDTLWQFLKFGNPPSKYYLGILLHLPFFVIFTLLRKRGVAKEMLLSFYFKGISKDDLLLKGRQFCATELPKYLFMDAMEKIAWHQKEQHRIIIVSASLDIWIKPWAESLGLELICTEYEFVNNKATGRFATKNCNDHEKVRRILSVTNPDDYDTVYAYGNSKGDLPMLALANQKHYLAFNKIPKI
ncbi:MAG: HAD-IB family hydrolase [Cyclobacteriaceae bacterium]